MHLQGKIPTTVFTGFLGAGKTSLIRNLLRQSEGRRLALIINEFGDIGIDRELVLGCGDATCAEDDVVELANGCICCTVADDFVPTMRRLIERDLPPEHIVIETSGLALPKPLIKAFNWPEIRTRVTVDGVVAVVDAAAVRDGLFAEDPEAVASQRAADPALDHDSPLAELFEEQLGSADLVVVNKADLLADADWPEVERRVRAELRPGVRLVRAHHAALPIEVLLGLGAAAESDLAARRSHHDDGTDHEHDDFYLPPHRAGARRPRSLPRPPRGDDRPPPDPPGQGLPRDRGQADAPRPAGRGRSHPALFRPRLAAERGARGPAGGDRRARPRPEPRRGGARRLRPMQPPCTC